jgi:molybdopterin converting factor small subunit
MIKVKVEFLSGMPETLRLAQADEEIVLENTNGEDGTVRNLLSRLAVKYPRFNELFFDTASRKLNGRLTIFCNSQRLELLNGLETKLNDGDVITLMPPIEGG